MVFRAFSTWSDVAGLETVTSLVEKILVCEVGGKGRQVDVNLMEHSCGEDDVNPVHPCPAGGAPVVLRLSGAFVLLTTRKGCALSQRHLPETGTGHGLSKDTRKGCLSFSQQGSV